MPITPIFNANSNSTGPDEQGCFHFEGQANTEAEVTAYRTDYQVGSIIICAGEDAGNKFSFWLLGLDSSNSGHKVWKKVTVE